MKILLHVKLFCARERQNISEKSFFYHKTVFLELDPPFLKRDRVSIQIFLLRAAAQALGGTYKALPISEPQSANCF